MVDRILKGARPGDLPIEVVTQHKLSINFRIARQIGVIISPELRTRAESVIE
jgi:putative tryptophan/tyrosine transport system substrate-binding protein